jgi:ABC-type multidrug transport system ATPase subunit
MSYFVELNNVLGIGNLNFEVPTTPGVYLLTGPNGCGKTTLLVALARIKQSDAFMRYLRPCKKGNIDDFSSSEFIFRTDQSSVTYKRHDKKWVPRPRKSLTLSEFPFKWSKFISTSVEGRFYTQNKEILERRIRYTPASQVIKNAMNTIFSTNRFDNLCYIEVQGKRGRQQRLHRKNKFYVVNDRNEKYSEFNFSLGERLLLNTMEAISEGGIDGLLLIDEIELALHPFAQIKFYELLRTVASDNNLVIIVSTHSPTLVKYAKSNFYLEKNDNQVNVVENAYPSYILNEISLPVDRVNDFVFLVEDEMAYRYLNQVYKIYSHKENLKLRIVIVPIGPWDSVVRSVSRFSISLYYTQEQLQAFVDYDVKESKDELLNKNPRSPKEQAKLDLLQAFQNNISFLPITPELGFWEWLQTGGTALFEQKLRDNFGDVPSLDMDAIVNQVDVEENGHGRNERDHAKGCIKNIQDKVVAAMPGLLQADEVLNNLIQVYVEDYLSKSENYNKFKGVFNMIFNRN